MTSLSRRENLAMPVQPCFILAKRSETNPNRVSSFYRTSPTCSTSVVRGRLTLVFWGILPDQWGETVSLTLRKSKAPSFPEYLRDLFSLTPRHKGKTEGLRRDWPYRGCI
jgi:hypothetical protein